MKTRLLVITVALAVGALAVGCSSGSSSSSGGSSGKAAVCSARTQLADSIRSLTKPSVLTGGTKGINDAVSSVKQDFSAFQKAAKTEYQPQVDAVKSSLDAVETSAGKLGDVSSIGTNLEKLGTAIGDLGTSMQQLSHTVQQQCPSK